MPHGRQCSASHNPSSSARISAPNRSSLSRNGQDAEKRIPVFGSHRRRAWVDQVAPDYLLGHPRSWSGDRTDGTGVSAWEDRRLTRNGPLLASCGLGRTQNIPKRVTNGEPTTGHPETGAPLVYAVLLSREGGAFSIPKIQGICSRRVRGVFSVPRRVTNGDRSSRANRLFKGNGTAVPIPYNSTYRVDHNTVVDNTVVS